MAIKAPIKGETTQLATIPDKKCQLTADIPAAAIPAPIIPPPQSVKWKQERLLEWLHATTTPHSKG